MTGQSFDDLVAVIMRALEIDWQYVEVCDGWDTARVAEVRSAGRSAGRRLRTRIVTMERERDDGRIAVFVVVRDWPDDPEERARMEERGALLISRL